MLIQKPIDSNPALFELWKLTQELPYYRTRQVLFEKIGYTKMKHHQIGYNYLTGGLTTKFFLTDAYNL